MANSEEGGGFVTGFMFGGVIGFLVGILTAPRPGGELRAELMERTHHFREQAEVMAESITDQARQRAEGFAHKARSRAEQLAAEARHRLGLEHESEVVDPEEPTTEVSADNSADETKQA